MIKESTHTRIYTDALQNLRRIHAETGERMLDIVDRLLSAEINRIRSIQNAADCKPVEE